MNTFPNPTFPPMENSPQQPFPQAGFNPGVPYPQQGFMPTTPMQPGFQMPFPQQMAPQSSYIENILRLNLGKVATIYMNFENSQWGSKVFKGILRAAGKDHIIVVDPDTGIRYLLLTIYLDYITFDVPITYEYPFTGAEGPGMPTQPFPQQPMQPQPFPQQPMQPQPFPQQPMQPQQFSQQPVIPPFTQVRKKETKE